ncbi:MAG: hypothetical protein IIV72_03205, partial [Alistipes sp.]|nr:hypothetical protein [Alistipes sp.]
MPSDSDVLPCYFLLKALKPLRHHIQLATATIPAIKNLKFPNENADTKRNIATTARRMTTPQTKTFI